MVSETKYGAHHAIKKISIIGTGSYLAIEGDIEDAYGSVNHDILKQILEKHISDKKLLKLIYQGFKAGILDQGEKSTVLLEFLKEVSLAQSY